MAAYGRILSSVSSGDVARATLRELFPNAITLQPDDSGEHLWAVFLDDEVSRISLLYDTTDELLDAQAVATIAAFARAEAERQVGDNGRGAGFRFRLLLSDSP